MAVPDESRVSQTRTADVHAGVVGGRVRPSRGLGRLVNRAVRGIERLSRSFGSAGHADVRDDAERTVQLWIRGLLPADDTRHAVMYFDGWRQPRVSVEISRDASGNLRVANCEAVQLAINTILAGETVVVQVCTSERPAEGPTADGAHAETIDIPPTTTRVWVFDLDGPRPVDANVLVANASADPAAVRDNKGAHFETGWPVTGLPGGA